MAINFKSDEQWNREAKRAAENIGGKIREAHRDYLVAKEEASDKKKAWAALIVELQETVEYYSRYGPGKENPPPRQGTVDDLDDEDEYREPGEKIVWPTDFGPSRRFYDLGQRFPEIVNRIPARNPVPYQIR